MRCYACHQLNSATARFCIECGAALTAAVQSSAANPVFAPASYGVPQAAPVAPTYGAGQYPTPQQGRPEGYAAPYALPPAQPAAYAQFGYGGPQPSAAPASLVNNVTVTHAQLATAPIARARRPASVARRSSALVIILAALYFLASGAAVGALWFVMLRPYAYTPPVGYLLALVLTLVVLFSDIVILDRMNRG